ncbi:uncharacterized protein LOC123528045 [Mercenaria mercenaria]|uniref:uncharacterized protein LOC123528045 n=1 Tax=Mercenaria mercenaria TaxID=6596 RepID=UPI00234E5AC8|nr:uncharacterized protein LOC123528045 [Mercenaria mercenaria]XP_053379047.1 uncharacterized protein LOC123528045 [Mercenaria mercenaria]
MLSIYASNGSMVDEANLRKYLDVIVKDKSKMAIKTAAIVYDNGNIAAKTNTFKISHEDLLNIKQAFLTPSTEKIQYCDVTYCVKSKTREQLVAFNGTNYVIVSKTDVTFIIVTCCSRQKYSTLAAWINAVAKKLRERHT